VEHTVADYVDGRLRGAALDEVVRHADRCEACRELIQRALPADSGEPVPRPPNRVGTVLASKYRIDRLLGSGGMGVVYEAENTWTARRVAIKLLHPFFSSEPEVVQRFLQEAKNASRIDHPNVVDVLDMGQDPVSGSLYMVQEFLVGETLRDRLRSAGRLSVAKACAVLLPILEALDAAHRAGVIHRDVKPENIFLTHRQSGEPEPKLIDFGVSKVMARELAVELSTQKPIGTPLYMSPEQLRVEDDIDERSDVWSMGVVLYEAVCGRRPFDARSNIEVGMQILAGGFLPPRDVAPEVPVALGRVIERALASERSGRFPTVREMIDALVSARTAPASRLSRRYPWLIGGGSAVLVAVWVLLSGGTSPSSTTKARPQPSDPPPVMTPPGPSPPPVAEPAKPLVVPASTNAAPASTSHRKRSLRRSPAPASAPAPSPAEATAPPAIPAAAPPPPDRPAAPPLPPILPP